MANFGFFLCFCLLLGNLQAEMSLDEKIGQLFMLPGYLDADFATKEEGQEAANLQKYVTEYGIGGVCFVGPSNSSRQVTYINTLQQSAKYPLLIAQDFEWGLSMRMKDGMRFPKNSTLGACSDTSLIYAMGKEIGRQAKLVGVHMNLSPVLDVNTEPDNLVINVRSFGATKEIVATHGVAIIQGLQDAGIMASAKHFPGLGDIVIDPHLGLPKVTHDVDRLETVEFYPFRQAIKANVLSIQTDHVLVPAIENVPSSLSPKIVQGILKDKMGFKGLVISGALRMKALVDSIDQEEIAVRAFLAGSDMLLMPYDFPRAHAAIKRAVLDGVIALEDIDARVEKILKLKEQFCKRQELMVPKYEELHTQDAAMLKQKIYESCVSVVRNNGLLPLEKSDSICYLQIGEGPVGFYEALKCQIKEAIFIPMAACDEKVVMSALERHSKVVVAVYPLDPRRIAQIRLLEGAKQDEELKQFTVHGIPAGVVKLVRGLREQEKKCVVCYFGNPFGMHFFDHFSTFVMGFEDDAVAQEAVLKAIMG
ncbi:MAG: hypothetical protein LLF94_11530 [Chlamydiales bacterium]|nr:hypothetical protein [Chlamydiales bacterium]